MRYKELLKEQARSHLYHNTSLEKLDTILRTNTLPATWAHVLPDGSKKTGSSLTRNPQLGRRIWTTPFGPVQLVLNQDKLQQNYKLIPLDAENALQKQVDPSRLDDPRWQKRYNDRLLRAREQPFAEEFVVGDVKPLSKYLEKIIWIQEYDPQWNKKYEQDLRLIRQYARQHEIPFIDVNKKNQKQFTQQDGRAVPRKRDKVKGVNL